jgi:hypothetical protein
MGMLRISCKVLNANIKEREADFKGLLNASGVHILIPIEGDFGIKFKKASGATGMLVTPRLDCILKSQTPCNWMP